MDTFVMDQDSLMLAIQLQREDLELWDKSRKGKHRDGEIPDSDLALETCRYELESLENLISDRALSLSIARAVEADGGAIAAARTVEGQAARDREFALRLSSDPRARPGPSQTKAKNGDAATGDLDDEMLEKLKALYIGLTGPAAFDSDSDDSDLFVQAESSSWAATRRHAKTRECICCGDSFPPLALSPCPCTHEYCRGCLVTLVRCSLQDESLFPPRCCSQRIPIEGNARFLSPELVGEYRAKEVEFETPNRTYCSDPFCSTFVPPQFIADEVGHCPRCGRRTCVHCKGGSHQGICPSDSASQEVLRIAADNGWQQCTACGRVVELEHGCNHMTCRCGHQFCYICGDRWKTCQCPQWNEDRLLARANAIVDRADDVAQIDARTRQARVQREQRNLVENHQCNHDRWRGRSGPRRCEECSDVLPVFIYECRQCRILACRRCRYNRL
ncbi:hypothetical protein B0J13DRAFT_631740 [Dactylonectria estremocensis]|uniref:RBR-type E3 ubiquitin transferase n=1 Tax=Dactylonectria estremocensis TaxID=1079267 RepID=A0A9P9I9R5_9HYPO|nr:hypothetical protein B0J13DRAFT_631740 [Dactylonectria estremocensis]